MRARAVRRIDDRSMELEPVVSYSPIPPDNDPEKGEERVEPRLTVLPLERKRRTASVAPPSAEEAAGRDGDIEDAEIIEAEFVAPPRRGRSPRAVALEDERPRRRFPVVVMLGLVALVLGIAVLAFTFTRIMNSSVAVTPAATVPASDVAAPTDDSGSAGPGVITLPPEATAPSAAKSASKGGAATATTDSGAAATASQPPPLPRLRPANDTGAAPAAAAAPAEAAPRPAAPVIAPAVATAPAAGQASDSDVDSLMQDVGRILAAPPSSATTAPADVTAGSAPAVAAPAAADAPGAATSTADYPPLPAPSQPLRRRRWFEDNGQAMPVPPAEIPDPEGAAGQ